MVVWTSAYNGGRLLDAYAATHMYWVISSVRTECARVISPTGRTVAESSRWDGVAIADIDPAMELFHIDRQYGKIAQIRRALGESVRIETYNDENNFTLSCLDPAWNPARVAREFGLASYRDYHAEATAVQRDFRARYGVNP